MATMAVDPDSNLFWHIAALLFYYFIILSEFTTIQLGEFTTEVSKASALTNRTNKITMMESR